MMPSDITAALIGALSALVITVGKDGFLREHTQRQARKKAFIQDQMHQAYGPLRFLVYEYLQTDTHEAQSAMRPQIMTLLQEKGHLLSPPTLDALYVLLHDKNQGAQLLNASFFTEYNQLINHYRTVHAMPHV